MFRFCVVWVVLVCCCVVCVVLLCDIVLLRCCFVLCGVFCCFMRWFGLVGSGFVIVLVCVFANGVVRIVACVLNAHCACCG